jgi:hypothetical protein
MKNFVSQLLDYGIDLLDCFRTWATASLLTSTSVSTIPILLTDVSYLGQPTIIKIKTDTPMKITIEHKGKDFPHMIMPNDPDVLNLKIVKTALVDYIAAIWGACSFVLTHHCLITLNRIWVATGIPNPCSLDVPQNEKGRLICQPQCNWGVPES